MPARNGYDRELVFEEAESCARRYGEALLELARSAVMIRVVGDPLASCERCSQPLDRLHFALADRRLCRRCVRRTVR